MAIATLIYFIGIILFISSGIRAFASDIEYKRTGERKTNFHFSIRFILSILCFIIGTYIMTHFY